MLGSFLLSYTQVFIHKSRYHHELLNEEFFVPKSIDTPMIIRSSKKDSFLRANVSFMEKICISSDELAKKSFSDWIVPEDQSKLSKLFEGKIDNCLLRHKTKSVEIVKLDVQISSKQGDDYIILAKIAEDENNQNNSNNFYGDINKKSTMFQIASIVEIQNPGYKCSILLLENGRFVIGAGPSLPDYYNNAINGFPIGPTVGSCGTAIFWNTPVIVTDIQNDPLWVDFAEIALKAGVHSCWSHPFSSKSGKVLGAIALYYPEPRSPSNEQLVQLKANAALTGLAVDREIAEKVLLIKHQDDNKAKSRFLANISHEIRNPANGMMGMIEVLMHSSGLSLEQSKMLDLAQSSGKSLIKILDDILDHTKIDANYLLIEKVNFNLSKFIKEIISTCSFFANNKNIKLLINIEENTHQNLLGDPIRLKQVLINIISNAIKFTHTGSVILSVSSKHLRSNNCKVKFSIEDTGIGINEEYQVKLFDPFIQADSSITRQYGGTGLGLSISKKLIELMNGTVNFRSKLGKGTTFDISIPLETSDALVTKEQQIKLNENIKIEKIAELYPHNILLVEDNVINQKLMQLMLKKLGYKCKIVKNGQEAIAALKEINYSIVFMDIQMPIMDGISTTKKVVETYGNLKPNIIGISANAFDSDKTNALKAGMVDYIIKPLNLKKIQETLIKFKNNI